MTMNLQQQSDECGYALEAFAKVLKNNNIEAVGKPNIELMMEYQKEYRKIEIRNEQIQNEMFERAKKTRDESIVKLTSWDGFITALDDRKLILTPWCNTKESEELVKKKSTAESAGGAAKTLCIPFEQPALEEGTKCFITGEPAKCWVLWGRSY